MGYRRVQQVDVQRGRPDARHEALGPGGDKEYSHEERHTLDQHAGGSSAPIQPGLPPSRLHKHLAGRAAPVGSVRAGQLHFEHVVPVEEQLHPGNEHQQPAILRRRAGVRHHLQNGLEGTDVPQAEPRQKAEGGGEGAAISGGAVLVEVEEPVQSLVVATHTGGHNHHGEHVDLGHLGEEKEDSGPPKDKSNQVPRPLLVGHVPGEEILHAVLRLVDVELLQEVEHDPDTNNGPQQGGADQVLHVPPQALRRRRSLAHQATDEAEHGHHHISEGFHHEVGLVLPTVHPGDGVDVGSSVLPVHQMPPNNAYHQQALGIVQHREPAHLLHGPQLHLIAHQAEDHETHHRAHQGQPEAGPGFPGHGLDARQLLLLDLTGDGLLVPDLDLLKPVHGMRRRGRKRHALHCGLASGPLRFSSWLLALASLSPRLATSCISLIRAPLATSSLAGPVGVLPAGGGRRRQAVAGR
mmetsp:Transcript_2808/g.6879  ORF Transcript_2808/g.6879 Transcript_2808/m.6879 type:complete len:466 (+) Transcript_2808:336-1733(+)